MCRLGTTDPSYSLRIVLGTRMAKGRREARQYEYCELANIANTVGAFVFDIFRDILRLSLQALHLGGLCVE